MTQVRPGDRLTAEDAAFLYFETDEMPLHIGSVSVFEGAIPFEPLVKYVESRLPLIPRYRQRLVTPPLHFGHPTWEPDPDFDVRNHVHLVKLKRGADSDLRTLAAKIFDRKMNRDQPLWDLTLVHGLNGGRCGLISRVHHCLVDGVSGTGLMNVMLNAQDISSAHKTALHERARPLPGPETSLADALASSYSETLDRVVSAQAATLNILQSLTDSKTVSGFNELVRLAPSMSGPVERLPFNRPLAGRRRVAWADFSLPDFKAIKDAHGATINDVVLTILTMAIQRYAELHGVPVKNRMLRLMVPVNVRTSENDNGYGNRVSMLPVSLPLDVRRPLKLLEIVRETTCALKSSHVADLISLMSIWMGATPAPVQALLGSMATFVPLPAFNMVCTNVPGPQFPLYALGVKMLTYHPYVPVGGEMGVNCAIQSYDGRLYFGLTGDVAAAPDLGRLNAFLESAFLDLRKAACGPPPRKRRRAPHVDPPVKQPLHANRQSNAVPAPVLTERGRSLQML